MQKGNEVQSKYGPIVLVTASQDAATATVPELEKGGFEVALCADAKRALNVFDSKPARWAPSLIIVDVTMPQMSGFEIVRRLAGTCTERKIPIMLMAQYKSPEDELEATTAGAAGVLPKPLTSSAIEDIFERERIKKLKAEIGGMVFEINND